MLPDVIAQDLSLDNDYGATHGPNSPDEHEVMLLGADGLELDSVTSPGYERAIVTAADWPPASGGSKSVRVTFAPPEAEWEPIAGWQLIDASTGVRWEAGALYDPLYVTDASGEGPVITITVSYQPA